MLKLRDSDSLEDISASVGETAPERIAEPAHMDFLKLATTDPKPPAFVLKPWIPKNATTLFPGHGGAGKSMLALTMAVCIALNRPFFDIQVERRFKVAFYSCEDDVEIIHWRLVKICKDLGADIQDLANWLFVYDMTSVENTLFVESYNHDECFTPRYGWLAEKIEENRIEVLFVDNASDVFDANEIQRSKVRRFIQSLNNLIRPNDGAVILLAHIDKAAAKSKDNVESYSGSTAWHNSVRSRLSLTVENDSLTLAHAKSNHSKKADPITLRWTEHGTLELAEPVPLRDRIGSNEQQAVVRLIAEFESRGEWIAPAPNSPINAYKMIQAEPNYPGLKRNELYTLLRELERRELITRTEFKDSYRNKKQRWSVTEKGHEFIGALSA
ncbi:MAG: AAA family ATPase [Gammaproteobacteria bacterium]|nr:AAA family ATPase [Gammaproteobacteria bacterium]MDH5799999.1 AAA family ATPase [Gammaproteobacteria bacterium]